MSYEKYVDDCNIDFKKNSWMESIKKRNRDSLILDPMRVALIIIDVQNYFTDKKSIAYLPSSDVVIPRINYIKDLFLDNKLPLFATIHINNKDNLGVLATLYNDYIKEDKLSFSIDKKNIIQKTTYDAFYKTDLDQKLKKSGIEQILISGCMTHLCCETTARSALVKNYEVFFLCDGTFTKNEDLHLGTLKNISDGFGKIITVDEVARCIQSI